jgi:hypothetical protein
MYLASAGHLGWLNPAMFRARGFCTSAEFVLPLALKVDLSKCAIGPWNTENQSAEI